MFEISDPSFFDAVHARIAQDVAVHPETAAKRALALSRILHERLCSAEASLANAKTELAEAERLRKYPGLIHRPNEQPDGYRKG